MIGAEAGVGSVYEAMRSSLEVMDNIETLITNFLSQEVEKAHYLLTELTNILNHQRQCLEDMEKIIPLVVILMERERSLRVQLIQSSSGVEERERLGVRYSSRSARDESEVVEADRDRVDQSAMVRRKEEATAHYEKDPQLVLSHLNDENHESYEIFSPLYDFMGKHICYISELQDTIVMATCHDWLLLISNEDPRNFYLWNSNSYETINLPPLKYSEVYQYRCVLTSVPTDPKGLVILSDRFHPRLIFCKPRSEKWSVQDITEDLYINGAVLTFPNIVSIHGIVYACTIEGRLFMITVINSNKLSVKHLQANLLDIPWMDFSFRQWLIESCSELFMVFEANPAGNLKEISRVLLFKMDFLKMNWVKMESLKDRALFLGEKYSVSCCVSDYPDIEGNCIYFVSIFGRILYSFNMENRSLSPLKSFLNIRVLFGSSWIIPNIRLADKLIEEECDKEGNEKIDKERSEFKAVFVEEADVGNDISFDILDLPFDILELIGKRLILFDYLYFRATCREFQGAAPPIQWRSACIASEKELLSPWFMSFKNDGGTCNIIDSNPRNNDTYFINFPKLLSSAPIHFSKNGWLLMSTDSDSFCLFNPCTKMIRPLPKINSLHLPTHLGFSSSPTSPNCLVVGITDFNDCTSVYAIHSGKEEWFHGRFDDEIFYPGNRSPVFCNERFWFLDDNGKLGVLRGGEDDNNFIWEVLTQLQSPCTSFESNYIVECEEELISIFVGDFGKWVKVFKLDYREMIWLEVKSLGKHMIFVSHSSCFSAVAKFTEMENKIYFPRFCGHNIMFYSLETQKFHSFTSEESITDFQFSRLPLHCGWIEPRW